jgi:hypothetical protein
MQRGAPNLRRGPHVEITRSATAELYAGGRRNHPEAAKPCGLKSRRPNHFILKISRFTETSPGRGHAERPSRGCR